MCNLNAQSFFENYIWVSNDLVETEETSYTQADLITRSLVNIRNGREQTLSQFHDPIDALLWLSPDGKWTLEYRNNDIDCASSTDVQKMINRTETDGSDWSNPHSVWHVSKAPQDPPSSIGWLNNDTWIATSPENTHGKRPMARLYYLTGGVDGLPRKCSSVNLDSRNDNFDATILACCPNGNVWVRLNPEDRKKMPDAITIASFKPGDNAARMHIIHSPLASYFNSTSGAEMTVSPDGAHIAWMTDYKPDTWTRFWNRLLLKLRIKPSPQPDTEIWITDMDGNHAHLAAAWHSANEGNYSNLGWTPDARALSIVYRKYATYKNNQVIEPESLKLLEARVDNL